MTYYIVLFLLLAYIWGSGIYRTTWDGTMCLFCDGVVASSDEATGRTRIQSYFRISCDIITCCECAEKTYLQHFIIIIVIIIIFIVSNTFLAQRDCYVDH